MRYKADITAGSLKVYESRIIADLLIRDRGQKEWDIALYQDNVLQTRNPATTRRVARLLRLRLQTMNTGLWHMVRDGTHEVTTQACLAAAVKHSVLLGDFLDLVIREQYQVFSSSLSLALWEHYIEDCRARDPVMPQWRESTVKRLRSSVFQILGQGGYIESTRTRRLQTVHIAQEVLSYLRSHDEKYVLRCIQVSP